MFIHHVFFWLRNPENKEDLARLKGGLVSLTKIKTIRQPHIGIPAGTNRDVIERSYSLSWLISFDNAADQDSYQEDPLHLAFVNECSGLWKKVLVYDNIDA